MIDNAFSQRDLQIVILRQTVKHLSSTNYSNSVLAKIIYFIFIVKIYWYPLVALTYLY